MSWSRKSLPALALVAMLVLAGCVGTFAGPGSAEEIADRIQNRHDRIDSIHGVQTTTVETGNTTRTTTVEIWQRPPSQIRRVVRDATGPAAQSVGDVTVVSNGTLVTYDRSANEVTRYDTGSAGATNPTIRAGTIESVLEDFEVEQTGNATVAGREAYVLELTPTNDSSAGYDSLTVWVDSEYWYPLRYEATTTHGDRTTELTMTYEEIEFNADVSDDRFTFEAPANATVSRPETPDVRRVENLSVADAETDFSVGRPAVPERFDLEHVQVTTYDGETSVMALYRSENGSLQYVVSDENLTDRGDETVRVGDREATVTTVGETTVLRWSCGGATHSLSARLDQDELVDVAESIDC